MPTPPPPPPMLPTAPLRALVSRLDSDGLANLVERAGYPGPWKGSGLARALQRKAVSVYLADRVCVALGLHPAMVYGLRWWALVLDEPEAVA